MRSKQRKIHRINEDRSSTPLSPNTHLNPRLSTDPGQPPKSKSNFKLLNNNQPSQSLQSEQLQLLTKENSQLKRQLIQMKVRQFYNFDDKKLKELFAEVQALKKELKKTKAEICQLQLHNDFLTRANAQLRLQLQKQIKSRKKESLSSQDYKSSLKSGFCKANDHTRNTDTSRNTEYEHYSVYHSTNFQIQNTTLQEAFQCRDMRRSREKLGLPCSQPIQRPTHRRNLLNKILSPRANKESSVQPGNQYLLLRGQKQKSPIWGKKS